MKKVLDFAWAKTKVKVQRARLKPQTLGNWIFRLLCKLLGFRAVTNSEELKKLLVDFRHQRVDVKTIVFFEDGGFHLVAELPDIIRVLRVFERSKGDVLVLEKL